jgi:hypothetical protein
MTTAIRCKQRQHLLPVFLPTQVGSLFVISISESPKLFDLLNALAFQLRWVGKPGLILVFVLSTLAVVTSVTFPHLSKKRAPSATCRSPGTPNRQQSAVSRPGRSAHSAPVQRRVFMDGLPAGCRCAAACRSAGRTEPGPTRRRRSNARLPRTQENAGRRKRCAPSTSRRCQTSSPLLDRLARVGLRFRRWMRCRQLACVLRLGSLHV